MGIPRLPLMVALALLAGCAKQDLNPPESPEGIGETPEAATKPAPLPDDSQKYNVTATRDAGDPNRFYIHRDLRDAFAELDKMLSPALKEEFKSKGPRDVATAQHFGLGLWIRNNWGLWAESRLYNHLRGLGLFHPDDMSSFLIESYCRYLKSPLPSDADYVKAFSQATSAPASP